MWLHTLSLWPGGPPDPKRGETYFFKTFFAVCQKENIWSKESAHVHSSSTILLTNVTPTGRPVTGFLLLVKAESSLLSEERWSQDGFFSANTFFWTLVVWKFYSRLCLEILFDVNNPPIWRNKHTPTNFSSPDSHPPPPDTRCQGSPVAPPSPSPSQPSTIRSLLQQPFSRIFNSVLVWSNFTQTLPFPRKDLNIL